MKSEARRIVLSGRVQGVGYRPFVWRIARAHGISGWVRNEAGQVIVHAEGANTALDAFEADLIGKAPALAHPKVEQVDRAAYEAIVEFSILASDDRTKADICLPPDLFCCTDCFNEMSDAGERRHRYPFINCTQCGPRYTIIKALPYDRPLTSMADFDMCPRCRAEYENPADRRFHAQPLACPDCGPRLSFHGYRRCNAVGEEALLEAVAMLKGGGIVAVKGVGGFHLMCDPTRDEAVMRLRARKHRPHKPFAVIFPQAGKDQLDIVRQSAIPSQMECDVLVDPVRPIVLVKRRDDCSLSRAVAPGLDTLGVFLPYSPLHYLLLSEFGGPLIATSGNLSGEPVLSDNLETVYRLGKVADAFLDHNRSILRPADDCVVRVIAERARPIRIGRGIAPLELRAPRTFTEPTLAVGGHMKVSVALGWDRRIVISPHIGDLGSPRSLEVFTRVIDDLQKLYRVEAVRIVCDAHPDYASTRWAQSQGRPLLSVQHHWAHASALAGEHPEIGRWLTFAWDGAGLGRNHELWGGEALLGAPSRWRRVASFKRFRLTGGDRAGREPWRSAAAVMWENGEDWMPNVKDAALARLAWEKAIGTTETSSVGRLFDAAAALVIGIETASYEGQGPIMLEGLAHVGDEVIRLELTRDDEGIFRADWSSLLPMLTDTCRAVEERASIFHSSMAQALADQVAVLASYEKFDAVGLTGGVFQNRKLTESVIARLKTQEVPVFLTESIPTNDGGLAFGQLVESLYVNKS